MHGLCGSKWDLKPDLNRCHRHETWTSSLLCHKCSLSCWLAACFVFSKWSVKRATIWTWLQKDVYSGSNYRNFDKKGFLKPWWRYENVRSLHWIKLISTLCKDDLWLVVRTSTESISSVRIMTWYGITEDGYFFL